MSSDPKQTGMFVSNTVIMGFGLFVLIIAFAAGFFAKGYFNSALIAQNDQSGTQQPIQPLQPTTNTKTPGEIFALVPEITDSDHLSGSKTANLVYIEYSDYQCPYCVQFHPTVKQFLGENKDVAFVFRHLPLTSIHPKAMERAQGAECAAKLGGADMFWKYTNEVFAASDIDSVTLSDFSARLGLNTIDFDACLKSGEFDQKISDMSSKGANFLASLNARGSYGTPGGAILNREKKVAVQIPGVVSVPTLTDYLNSIK